MRSKYSLARFVRFFHRRIVETFFSTPTRYAYRNSLTNFIFTTVDIAYAAFGSDATFRRTRKYVRLTRQGSEKRHFRLNFISFGILRHKYTLQDTPYLYGPIPRQFYVIFLCNFLFAEMRSSLCIAINI